MYYTAFILHFSLLCFFCYVFFFKQKTAYEMRISDWSSDLCSSDLAEKVIDMKLSLPQQLLGAFALAAVLSMGVVAPAAARDNDNQRSEHADKDKKHDKARANDRQDARRQQHKSELQSLIRTSYAVF